MKIERLVETLAPPAVVDDLDRIEIARANVAALKANVSLLRQELRHCYDALEAIAELSTRAERPGCQCKGCKVFERFNKRELRLP